MSSGGAKKGKAVAANQRAGTDGLWQSISSGTWELIKTLGPAILIALAVRSSVVQAFWVPSGSMEPTIQIGDHIFVNKLAYTIRFPLTDIALTEIESPKRGEVVVFVRPDQPETDLIKRVIAVGGDTVEIRKRKLYINGEEAEDPHAHFAERAPHHQRNNRRPLTVPPGKFFVMGDNRDRSLDSRFWGFADITDVKGRATFVYWSRDSQKCWNRVKNDGLANLFSRVCLPRWKRFGLHIH